jgi:hypothetical protein
MIQHQRGDGWRQGGFARQKAWLLYAGTGGASRLAYLGGW